MAGAAIRRTSSNPTWGLPRRSASPRDAAPMAIAARGEAPCFTNVRTDSGASALDGCEAATILAM